MLSYSLSPRTLEIYAMLKRMVYINDSVFYALQEEADPNLPLNCWVQIYDLSKPRKDTDWFAYNVNDDHNDFNMDFGVYQVKKADVFMMTHRDSVFVFPIDDSYYGGGGRYELIRRVLVVMAKDSSLVDAESFKNIVDNLFAHPIVFGYPFQPARYLDIDFEGCQLFISNPKIREQFAESYKKLIEHDMYNKSLDLQDNKDEKLDADEE
jgi:hypothetical protein